MKKIILFVSLFVFSFNFLNAQNITKESDYSKNWASFIFRKTIDMKGALYEGRPGGDLELVSGRSPLFLVKIYKFMGARSDQHAYYTHQVPISMFYDNAPALGVNLVEGYSIEGGKIMRYSKYIKSYQGKLDSWKKANSTFTNERWVANTDADWSSYPVPQPEDVNWADGEYAGELY
ncbi:hypothetical protein [Brachyspira hampsonii]|uniref:Uncharacterized protein n=1 Tax=Brachyspira hampsonii 30446 TaxID=1289135 RepID=A0A2U4EUB4_9SPIR|nr:hypothetical protein [Brachyspira hampsonii]EKV56105.1 hypothetical protein A966_12111 [Brachyspira hampsonii 30446]MBW5390726.1 hypothetical protein [Brachyspira hampsonii]MBW5395935.1 hypothetical protein [Brachyspira hampsonii]OEJ18053.1 hypothetical protein A9495_06505 [Brachyspira hampsonii]